MPSVHATLVPSLIMILIIRERERKSLSRGAGGFVNNLNLRIRQSAPALQSGFTSGHQGPICLYPDSRRGYEEPIACYRHGLAELKPSSKTAEKPERELQ